ncbi:PH domain-containing protein [Geodermatophilus pulveris]|uniref:PH domain-containing protein n=1 Tax=Geodermatophilus pulveris TaxID=1564159 RepID=UPI000B7937A8|nr:PH domain-containing protein [Geodermatophilus pulveris]
MTSPDVVLELRPPRPAVVLSLISALPAVVVVPMVLDGFSARFATVLLLLYVGALAFHAVTVLTRVRAHADGSLEVRNRLSTRRLHRTDVARVTAARQGGLGSAWRLELLLADGSTLPLIATQTPQSRPQRHLEERAAELRRWLGDAANR